MPEVWRLRLRRMFKNLKPNFKIAIVVDMWLTGFDVPSLDSIYIDQERDEIHFYLAVRSIVFKLTKGNAPDSAQVNKKVRELIAEALKSDGVEEIIKLG